MKYLYMLVVVLLLARGAMAAEQQPLLLAENGQARAVIVLSPQAEEPERFAASQLAEYLKKISGAEFPVVFDAPPTSAETVRLLVGDDAAKIADANFSTESLGREGLIVRTVGNDLILVGNLPRGTIYAVMTLLDDVLGCRWWSPTAATIPHKPTLTIPPLDIRYVPRVSFRGPYWADAYDGIYCVHNKLNSYHSAITDHQGGRFQVLDFVHTFYNLIHPNVYFAKHPEWFSEVNGVRLKDGGQLCLTNEEMRKQMVEEVKSRLRATPGVSTTSISQMDWGNWCQCANCAAVDKAEGDTPAGSLIHFINAVADEVGKEFPDVTIGTLAYEYTQKPPAHVKPRDNVAIWLCTTGTSYAHPLTDEKNKVFAERLRAWGAISKNVIIWDYVTNFANYVSPHPNLRTLGPNMKMFVENNVTGVFSQGAYSAPGAEFSELRSWVLARLMWNPDQDAQKLIEEFCRGYYGAAGDQVLAYIDTLHDAIAGTGETLEMTSQPLGDWLNAKTMYEALAHLRKAEHAVRSDAELRQRVKFAQMPLTYVYLMRWDELREQAKQMQVQWPFERPIKDVYEDFMALAQERGIVQWSESNARDAFQSVAERVALREDVAPPPGLSKSARGSWVDIQDGSFNLKTGTPTEPLAEIISDPPSSDGTSARVSGALDIRAIQKQLWRIFLVHAAQHRGKKLHVYASARCDIAGDADSDSVAFTYGITGDSETTNVFEGQAKLSDVRDGAYHTFDLGTHEDLRGWKSAWFAPAKNSAVKYVWVDRIWLVEE